MLSLQEIREITHNQCSCDEEIEQIRADINALAELLFESFQEQRRGKPRLLKENENSLRFPA